MHRATGIRLETVLSAVITTWSVATGCKPYRYGLTILFACDMPHVRLPWLGFLLAGIIHPGPVEAAGIVLRR